MLPRIAELLIFGLLPFLVGSLTGSVTDITDDESRAREVQMLQQADEDAETETTQTIESRQQD